MIDTPEERIATLTPRELDVARLAARGYSARYIADRYSLSARTIETHTRHIYEKLEIGHRDVLIERYADALLGDDRRPRPELVTDYVIKSDGTITKACPTCSGYGRINLGTRGLCGWSAQCPNCGGYGQVPLS